MKKTTISILLLLLLFFSCEEVVTPDLSTEQPRLVIDANLNWDPNINSGSSQFIKLSLSTAFYAQNSDIPVNNATVLVTNTETNVEFTFLLVADGIYTNNNFVPIVNHNYQLTINYQNQIYTATERMLPTPAIDSVYQSVDGGFDSDAIEVNVDITDNANEENYYLIEFFAEREGFPLRNTIPDEFFNGNTFTTFAETSDLFDDDEEPLQTGDEVSIQLFGISERFYNFFTLLLEQDEPGGPFATIPAALRGNVINTTNPDNFSYGYFRCNQIKTANFTVQ